MTQYLVIDLDYNEIRGVFATPQQAEQYTDTFDGVGKGYHSKGFLITPVNFDNNGKIAPVEYDTTAADDEINLSFKKALEEKEEKPEENLDDLFAEDFPEEDNMDRFEALGIKEELEELK